jgi:hypothetical protein
LTPEERAAQRLLARHGLSPPIDVRALASEYADIEDVEMPVRGDAVVIHHPKGHRRPLILLGKKRTSAERERFTLAHEIGHIIIPWHYGTISCSPTEGELLISDEFGMTEAEANRFASELLIPREWLESFIQRFSRIEDIFRKVVETAVVSYEAARIKLVGCLPPGYACVVEGMPGSSPRIDCSVGTPLNLYIDYSDRSDPTRLLRALDRHATDSCTIPRWQGTIRWWRLDCRCDVPNIDDDRISTVILRDLLELLLDDPRVILKREQRINGLVGATNASCTGLRDVDTIFGAMKLRFSKRDVLLDERLIEIVNHSEFDVYLITKAKELASGQNKKRPRSSGARRRQPPPLSTEEEDPLF